MYSIYEAEQRLDELDIDGFEYQIRNFRHLKPGLEIADSLAMSAKSSLLQGDYSAAIKQSEAALCILETHPWALYYRILAMCCMLPEGDRRDYADTMTKCGFIYATIHLNEVCWNQFKNLIEESGELTLPRLKEYAALGRSSCQELTISEWNLNQERDRLTSEAIAIAQKIGLTEDWSNRQNNEVLSLYFSLSRYLHLLIAKHKIRAHYQHERLVLAYRLIASCAYSKGILTAEIADNISLCAKLIGTPEFWLKPIPPECLASGQQATPELSLWLKKYGSKLRRDPYKQGIFYGNYRFCFKFHSLNEVYSDTYLQEVAKIKRSNPLFKLVAFDHFFGGTEVWQLELRNKELGGKKQPKKKTD